MQAEVVPLEVPQEDHHHCHVTRHAQHEAGAQHPTADQIPKRDGSAV